MKNVHTNKGGLKMHICSWCGKQFRNQRKEWTLITETDIHACCSKKCYIEMMADKKIVQIS